MKQSDLFAYASTFVSFLIRELKDSMKDVNKIVLYGSVARNEAEKDSDVDIFVDTKKSLHTKELVEKFYHSREAALFRAKGIELKLSVKVGELKKWKELENSISSSGIILWGRYESKGFPGKHKIIFSWDEINKNRGAFLNKLYGVKVKEKHYPGLLQQYGGEKVGKSSIIVPFQYREELISLFKKYGVKARHWDVLVKE